MANKHSSLEFLNPVTAKEAQSLLAIVTASSYPVSIKTDDSEEFKTRVIPGGSGFQIEIPNGFSANEGQNITVALIEGREKYVLYGPVHMAGSVFSFDSRMVVKKVQRRENFRVQILGKLKVQLWIQFADSSPLNLEFGILDLSYGGCQFEVVDMSLPISTGVEITGEVRSAELATPIQVSGTVRRAVENEELGFKRIGVQFNPHGRGVEGPLMDLIMKCSRETQKHLAT